jgi:hypothetical protein
MSDPHGESAARRAFETKARWHQRQVALPLKEKVRILLQLQQLDLPLLLRQRPLREWERPWVVEP